MEQEWISCRSTIDTLNYFADFNNEGGKLCSFSRNVGCVAHSQDCPLLMYAYVSNMITVFCIQL